MVDGSRITVATATHSVGIILGASQASECSYWETSQYGLSRVIALLFVVGLCAFFTREISSNGDAGGDDSEIKRPDFVYHHPYVSSSYYISTKSLKTLTDTDRIQVQPRLRRLAGKGKDPKRNAKTRLAVVRPFCEFDAEALPTTFSCWNSLAPCKAVTNDLGDEEDFDSFNSTDDEERYFDQVGSNCLSDAAADVFLFYSQTFSENEVAFKAVDAIIDQFNEPGGWSQCFENIYAIEANIPQELDLYIPSAQEELYNWVNSPNRQSRLRLELFRVGSGVTMTASISWRATRFQ